MSGRPPRPPEDFEAFEAFEAGSFSELKTASKLRLSRDRRGFNYNSAEKYGNRCTNVKYFRDSLMRIDARRSEKGGSGEGLLEAPLRPPEAPSEAPSEAESRHRREVAGN